MSREGYHILGHAILESWEALAKGGQETAAMDAPEVIQRATRDIKLLAGLLDADVGLLQDILKAYGVSVDRGEDAPAAEESVSSGKAITITWPAQEFKNLGEFGLWVRSQEIGITMSQILRQTGKRAAAQLTIAEAKTAVEKILAWRAQQA